MNKWMELLLLIVIQLVYVPLLTLRTITMVKNLRVLTALFGFMEALIYVFGLAIVFTGEQSILEMVVYALGFSLGLFAGVFVEQKLAIGFTSFHVNINHHNPELIRVLREKGYGVTAFDAMGKESERVRLDIMTRRRNEMEQRELKLAHEPAAFIVAFEPTTFRGGYMEKLMGTRLSQANQKTKPAQTNQEEHSVLYEGVVEIKKEFEALQKQWNEE